MAAEPIGADWVRKREAIAKAEAEPDPLDQIAEDAEPALADKITAALRWAAGKAANDPGQHPDAVAAAVPHADFQSRLRDALEGILGVFRRGGQQAANDDPPIPPGSGKTIAFTFDALNPRTVEHAEQNRLDLVRQVSDDTRTAIRNAVAEGVAAGHPPDKIARAVRDSVGLTDAQAAFVRNYRAELESLDPGALDRQLRDARYDGTVKAAIDSGTALAPDRVDALVERYQDRWIRHRARVISRTETLNAANAGAGAAMRQARDRGDFGQATVIKKWMTAPGCCDLCEAISDQNPDGVGLDDVFRWELGDRSGEISEPTAHPSCRCVISHELRAPDGTVVDDLGDDAAAGDQPDGAVQPPDDAEAQ